MIIRDCGPGILRPPTLLRSFGLILDHDGEGAGEVLEGLQLDRPWVLWAHGSARVNPGEEEELQVKV